MNLSYRFVGTGGFPPIELQNDKEKMVVAINKNGIKRIDKYKKSINQQPLLFNLQFSNVWAKTKVLTILKTDHSKWPTFCFQMVRLSSFQIAFKNGPFDN